MKAMIFSDLITVKNSLFALFGITVFVGVFISIATETLVTGVAAIAAMVPFMYLFSISAYDEQNGWERFRLTLPLSRKQVAYGRYASTFLIMVCSLVLACIVGLVMGAICSALPTTSVPEGLKLATFGFDFIVGTALATQLIMLIACIFTLPLIMRFGMTKGSRIVPVVIVLALSFGIAFTGNSTDLSLVDDLLVNGNITLILACITVCLVVLYALSTLVSAKLYEKREL